MPCALEAGQDSEDGAAIVGISAGAFELTVLYDDAPPGQMDATQDGRFVFWFEPTADGRTELWLNGQRGAPFDKLVSSPDGRPWIMSPDSRRFAYAFERVGKAFVGVDDVEYGPYENLSKQISPFFSPDGGHLVFAALEGEEVRLVVDGSEVPGVRPGAGRPVFSPDGSRLAYGAVRKDGRDFREWVVLDGRAEPEADGIGDGSMVFSPDGRRFAYARRNKSSWTYVIDGAVGPPYSRLDRGEFNHDGTRFAYPVFDGRQSFMVDNGSLGQGFERVALPTFSSDGHRLAYVAAAKKSELHVVVDGVPGPAWSDIWGDIVFSGDGARAAYLAQEISGGLLRRQTTYRAVVDGQPGRAFDEVRGSPAFAPDGRLAFAARSGEEWSVVIDDTPGTPFKWVSPPVWSASGRIGYVAGIDSSVVVVVDGALGPRLRSVVDLNGRLVTFSPDGRHIVYCGAVDEGLHVFVDGRRSDVMQGIDHPVFNGGSVSFLGLKDGQVVGLRVPLEQD